MEPKQYTLEEVAQVRSNICRGLTRDSTLWLAQQGG